VESLGGPSGDTKSDSEISAPVAIEDLYADLYERFVKLQSESSGFLALADRRLNAERDLFANELETLRGENIRVAQWALSLEDQVEFLTQQRRELPPT
jgi:hypothetical protein